MNILSSHQATTSYISEAQDRINKADISAEKKLFLHQEIDKALEFPFGKFILEHHGVNGEYSHQIFPWLFLSENTNNLPGGVSIKPMPNNFTNDLERFLLTQAPIATASQQRFKFFVQQIQLTIKDSKGKINIANFPCGWMSDLCLSLSFNSSLTNKIKSITGFDLDEANKAGIECLLKQYDLYKKINFNFVNADATKSMQNRFVGHYDLVIATGLSLYLDDAKCEKYFATLSSLLKPGGTLITSTMTPPDDWRNIDKDLAERERDFFFTICNVKFSFFRSTNTAVKLLNKYNFELQEIFHDHSHVFPTIVAKKSS